MTKNVKEQHPVRIYRDVWEKLKVKTKSDGISFQKLTEIFFKAYLKNNKEMNRLVESYTKRKGQERLGSLNEDETEELLRLIEEEYSPLRLIEEVDEEMKNE